VDVAEYDENRELKTYVWRNYPEIVRPNECFPPSEWIRDHLPGELSKEFLAYLAECDAIREQQQASESTWCDEVGCVVDSEPDIPKMSPELMKCVGAIIKEFEDQLMSKVLAANNTRIVICRCCRCNRVLKSPKSQQCLWCGYDWHGAERPNDGQPNSLSSVD
jgi:hypothetical protein